MHDAPNLDAIRARLDNGNIGNENVAERNREYGL
jgi:hypothetical protein